MNVFIIGGTGFIGFYAVLEFLRRGHHVSVLALPPLPSEDMFPREVDIKFGDYNLLSDEEIRSLLTGQNALVFAAGADDRTIPKAPAYDFYYQANVASCERLFALAREVGVQRGVILGSYFAYFERIWPEMKLAEKHPYIRSRIEQINRAMAVSLPDLKLMVLEMPYIFGAMPGRMPLWEPLIRYINYPIPLFYTRGGTNMISVDHVAEAVVGAVERGEGGQIYQIGDQNLTWVEMLNRLSNAAGVKKRVIILPDWIVRLGMWLFEFYVKLQGRESGQDPVSFVELQTSNTYLDPTHSRDTLGYGQGGLDKAFKDTVKACKK